MSDATPRVPTAAELSERIAFRRGVALLALTLLVPGSAQVITGGRGLGRFALRVWLVFVAVVGSFIALALLQRNWAIALYTHPVSQWLASAAVMVLGVGWALLMLDAWRLSRPRQMGQPRKYWMAALSGVLALTIGFSSAQASALSRTQAELFGSVFGGGGTTQAHDGRINLLLVGADAEPDRPGIRTDTIMVASVSATSGRTVLFSLPRNLQHAQFPKSSPLYKLYPGGYACPDQSCLLNAVHSEAEKHRDLYPGVEDPGMKAVREVVGETLGLKLNYHVVIDMRGFETLVDALGGVTLDIAKAVPIGGGSAKVEGYIQPGRDQHLNGYQALWFARSRHGSSDYERMTRQKCVVSALAKQATPLNLVTRFQELAKAGGAMVSSDIPGSELGSLVELADGGRRLPIASISFVPPLIEPSLPDLGLVKRTVKEYVKTSEELDREAERAAEEAARAAKASPSASASPSVAASGPTAAATAAPSTSPAAATEAVIAPTAPKATAGFSEVRKTDDLEAICGA
ncbi:MAG: LCP family protein [Actinomycetes bacterium]